MTEKRACAEASCYGAPDIREVLFSKEDLAERIRQIGRQITQDYRDVAGVTADGAPGILVVSVLRGAAVFMADLVRQIDLPLEMDYMTVSSYGAGTCSSGVVRIVKDVSSDIEGRHVIIAEDVLDSGLTLKRLLEILGSRKPASVAVAALVRKDNPDQADVDCRYIGFECPNEFIVGYGLDYAERYRNLPFIGVLKPEVYQGK